MLYYNRWYGRFKGYWSRGDDSMVYRIEDVILFAILGEFFMAGLTVYASVRYFWRTLHNWHSADRIQIFDFIQPVKWFKALR